MRESGIHKKPRTEILARKVAEDFDFRGDMVAAASGNTAMLEVIVCMKDWCVRADWVMEDACRCTAC
jgi:hypothetical protein